MKKVGLMICVLVLSGCLVRTYTIEKPRKDLTVTGNRGYLSGKPSTEPAPSKFGDKRNFTVFEIEFGQHPPEEKFPVKKSEPVQRSTLLLPEDFSIEKIERQAVMQQKAEVKEKKETAAAVVQKERPPVSYKVQKDDTLQKISMKFYGTTKRWKEIFDANKDVLANPDTVYPGQTIVIPSGGLQQ